jgi:hypothetical protein
VQQHAGCEGDGTGSDRLGANVHDGQGRLFLKAAEPTDASRRVAACTVLSPAQLSVTKYKAGVVTKYKAVQGRCGAPPRHFIATICLVMFGVEGHKIESNFSNDLVPIRGCNRKLRMWLSSPFNFVPPRCSNLIQFWERGLIMSGHTFQTRLRHSEVDVSSPSKSCWIHHGWGTMRCS